MRLILGLIKGIIVGGLVGYGAYRLELNGGWHWVTYGLAGAFVGLLVGRPFWSHLLDKSSTVLVSVLKGIVGLLIGVGLYAVVAKALGDMAVLKDIRISALQEQPRHLYDWQFLLGAAIGGLYGAWVEVDDAPGKDKAKDADEAAA